MAPLTYFDPNGVFWVWSPQGPTFSGTYYDRVFKNGLMLGCASAKEAERFHAAGLCCSMWSPGEVLTGWEPKGARTYQASFGVPESIIVERVVEKVVEKKVPVEVVKEVFKPPKLVGGLPDLSGIKSLPKKLPPAYKRLFEQYTAAGNLRK